MTYEVGYEYNGKPVILVVRPDVEFGFHEFLEVFFSIEFRLLLAPIVVVPKLLHLTLNFVFLVSFLD